MSGLDERRLILKAVASVINAAGQTTEYTLSVEKDPFISGTALVLSEQKGLSYINQFSESS